MSIYTSKVLELLAIEQELNKYYLKLRLSLDQDIEMRWEIDYETATNMKNITTFSEHYKYRLSLQSAHELGTNNHISFLTKTFKEHSERIAFVCSEQYVQRLHVIKDTQQLNEIIGLTFLSFQNTNEQEESIREQPKRKASINNYKLSWLTACVFLLTVTFLVVHMGNSNSVAEEFSKESQILVNNVKAQTIKEPIEQETEPLVQEEPVPFIIDSLFPTVELEDTLNYTIPKGSVAITFDDGPSEYTATIVDTLKEHEVGATFFFTGHNVKKYPDYVLYTKEQGYSIGNHSMNHTELTNLTVENQEQELLQTKNLLEGLIQEDILLFRPPYGATNEGLIELIEKHEHKMVLWNKDPKDWQTQNADEIINYIQSSDPSGSIILLHESQAVIDSLPTIIGYLLEQELEIVSLK
ncbi:polysaccharide deacetylase family protein [Bacillus solimangrovi]|uniref:NodB homology domain-containing protein n=1 Tax=Bacillus solimangrovi TaxID=1305675 RepID=A0A1E5LD57_9BACI|nr:polysaccharide deacetylase family protein [Bacillus solimangrovi]OEH92016.1 hypothetical protein BFG57_17275 [Bacillus solimangrovi]